MNLKPIEGVRIEPGETLVLVPERPLSNYQLCRMNEAAKAVGIKLLVLPHNSKVYVQGAE